MKKDKIFLSCNEEAAEVLLSSITGNEELHTLERSGFAEGYRRGKRPDVPLEVLADSLHKQYMDWLRVEGTGDKERKKKCLADLRNVAGILFLRLI